MSKQCRKYTPTVICPPGVAAGSHTFSFGPVPRSKRNGVDPGAGAPDLEEQERRAYERERAGLFRSSSR